MKIHEFQAKQILREAGVAVPRGMVARTAEEAAAAFTELGGSIAVVKAQIHAGGRGKGTVKDSQQHGVQLVKSADEAAKVAGNLLGKSLVTIQTGPEGQVVRQVLVEEGCEIARELYLGVVVDRAMAGPVLIASQAGGMNIEDVAAKTPELIFKEPFDPDAGLQPYQVRKLAAKLGLKGNSIRAAEKFMRSLCRVFVWKDGSLVEINPLVVTKSGELMALDAKMSFDDNALFRHPELAGDARLCRRRADRSAGPKSRAELRQARRQHRLPGERRRPGDEHDGPDQAPRRRTGEFPRCRRRREYRTSDRSVPHSAFRPERESRAGEHLRRHHALHDDRQCTWLKRTRLSVSMCRWSCGSKEPKSNRDAKIIAGSGVNIITADGLTDAAKKVVVGHCVVINRMFDRCTVSIIQRKRQSPFAEIVDVDYVPNALLYRTMRWHARTDAKSKFQIFSELRRVCRGNSVGQDKRLFSRESCLPH